MVGRWQIVLAEDNPADVRLVRAALQEHKVDCELRVFTSGDEVLAFFDNLNQDAQLPCPTALLLDLNLPKCDGIEVLSYLRASHRCAHIPVVVLTSSDSPKDHKDVERNAADHYFRKPFSLDEFLQLGGIVKALIGRSKPA